jgi:predicted Rossmann fold nucleotide-binding protein DprA/Smf involved in DNA uptake
MKLGVIGSRLFDDYEFLKNKILEHFDVSIIDTIVSGGAKGVDTLGERFADEFGIKKDISKPDWNKYGKGAAFIRNQEIVNCSDMLIAFPIKTSGGTWDTIRKAKKVGKNVLIYEVLPTKKFD